jgi:arginyl-tRNA--protein-N-Asp/Glu arginylyltransferase
MKILFSEFKSDYSNYIFPYAIWAFPEDGETPGQIFNRGFLPASLKLQRYYMCRHIRVRLADYSPSSENRRILRKGEDLTYRLLPIAEFDYTPEWRDFCKTYADIKFGKDIMTYQRLDTLFDSKVVTHLLVYHDPAQKQDIGLVTLYLEKDKMAYYYYSFYDLNYYSRNLGMYMMTSAVDYFSRTKKTYLYLGSCYSRNALYKTQFSGAEFFNGVQWSTNIKELKYLIERDKGTVKKHLLESETYREKFYDGDLNRIVAASDVVINPE